MQANSLFTLIKSLDKSEKRYFKLVAFHNNKSRKSNYVQFFEAIDRQKEYDEQAIKVQFRNQAFSKRIPAMKHLLFQNILKSLRHLQRERDDTFTLRSILDNAEILHRKNLLSLSKKQLHRANKIAVENGYHCYLPAITTLEHIYDQSHSGISKHDALSFHQKHCKLMKSSIDEMEYLNLLRHLRIIKRLKARQQYDVKEFQQTIANPLLVDPRSANTFLSNIYYHEIQSIIAQIVDNAKSAFHNIMQSLDLWDKNPSHQITYLELYRQNFQDALTIGLTDSNLLDYQYFHTKLEFFKTLDAAKKPETELLEDLLNISHSLHIHEYNDAQKSIRNLERRMAALKTNLKQEFTILIHFHIGLCYFLQADYQTSISTLGKVTELTRTGLLLNIQDSSRLLLTIAHYERGNIDFLDYHVRNIGRYFSGWKRHTKYYRVFLKAFLEIPYESNAKRLSDRIDSLGKELEKTKKFNAALHPMTHRAIMHWIDIKGNKK